MKKTVFFRKFTAILLVALMVLLTVPSYAIAEPENFEQLTEVPEGYIGVYTAADLNNVRYNMSGKYILMNDIEFDEADFNEGGKWFNDGYGWIPIGARLDEESYETFEGEFNGNGHIISGLCIFGDDRRGYSTGLFHTNGGIIRSLGIIGGVSYAYQNECAGSICGVNFETGQIIDCISSCDVVVYMYGGGICAVNYGTIDGCYNAGFVYNVEEPNSAFFIGGITGQNHDENGHANIKNSANIGVVSADVNGTYIYAGGITGEAYSKGGAYGTITNVAIARCYNDGIVYVNGTGTAYIGGITGECYAVINDCFNAGVVLVEEFSGSHCVGGIVGTHSQYTISRCYNVGLISVATNISRSGNISGYYSTRLTDCYYLSDTSYTGVSGGASSVDVEGCTPLTLEQMQDASSFTGFDFDGVWTMEGRMAYSFPELRDTPMMVYALGDINNDDKIDSMDLLILQQHLLGISLLENTTFADIDSNGSIESSDLLYLQQYLLGFDTLGAGSDEAQA